MNARKKIALRIVAIGMLSSGILASVAWFAPGTNSFSTRITGNLVEEYFHCGNGTEANPFVITRPVHYYHLTEFFQRETVLPTSDGDKHFGSDYLYFQVGYPLKENDSSLYVYDYDNTGTYTGTVSSPSYSKTLNMSYFSNENALMPIGTNEVPFFGSFDGGAQDNAGNGITISNLNIKTADTVVINNTPISRTTSDAGVFGYVADQKDASHKTVIANAYFDNLTIDLTGASSSGNSDAAHIDSHTNNNIYVGYVVGHMHTYNRYDSTGPTNSSPLHDVYVNNAKIEGGAGAVSKFGYVGFADTIDGVSGDDIDYADIIDDLAASSGGGGGGQGDDWGGSLDMRSLNQRLKAIMTGDDVSYYNTGTSYRYFAYHENNETKISLGRGERIDNYLKKDPDNAMVVYNLMGDGNHYYRSGNYGTLPGTAMPLLVNDDHSTASKNTGYIVSNTRAETSGTYNGQYRFNSSVRSASYYVSHIANSISDTALSRVDAYPDKASGNTFEVTYDSSTAEILTNKSVNYSATNFALIKDNYNKNHTVSNSFLTPYTKNDTTTPEALKLEKYNDSKASLNDVLTDAAYVHGIHFMDDDVLYNKTITLNQVILNGETYSNYSFPKSCIDFNLKEAGKINFFGGSYYNKSSAAGSYADCFFSLSVIERNGNDLTSNSIKKISYIYKNNAYDNTNPDSQKYIYRYSDNSYSDSQSNVGDLVFDMRFITEQPPVDNAIYYFEIPVNKGEYALHGVSGHDAGGYLMYLDIGASGGEEQPSDYNTDNMISSDAIFTQMEYTSSGYVINSCFNISYAVPAGATKESFYIKVSRSGTIFAVEVINTTVNAFYLNILLVDNDDDPDNDYPYTYTLKYNTGAVSSEYNHSGSFIGAASGTSFVLQT